MKPTTPQIIACAVLFALAVNLHSQGIVPKSPLDKLKDMKARNAELLDKQAATLQKLDEMDKAAEQLRFLSKRT
jgi:hypothetical protein